MCKYFSGISCDRRLLPANLFSHTYHLREIPNEITDTYIYICIEWPKIKEEENEKHEQQERMSRAANVWDDYDFHLKS